MNIYTVKNTDIVHNTSVDLITRWYAREVHIVQYDNSQPIVAVKLFKNSERFVLPDGYEANLRFGKKDRTFIYKPVLGCNQDRDTVYFAVDEQMSMFYGKVNPIIELTYNGAVVGSSSIPFVIDRNPIQIGDVESKSDYPSIVERISAAENTADDAKKAVDAEAAERAAGDAKKQDILVSGTNIKSINGQSLLGSGDMTIGLPKPWESGTMGGSTPYLGVHRVEGGIYSGFFEADGRALYGLFSDDYGAYYNAEINADNPILFVANKGDITSMVKLPSDFITNSQEITLGSGLPSYVYTDNASADGKSGVIIKEHFIGVQAVTSDKKYNNIGLNVTEDFVFATFNDAKKNNTLYILPDGLSSDFANTVSIPAKTGVMALTSDLDTKQDKLISGTNIKTINGESILGSGNIAISGGSGLASPWVSEEKCIGITDNQGFYMGLLNIFGSALYGEIIYDSKNSSNPPLAACVMGLSCEYENNNIIMFSDTETNVNSFVNLPEDFKTRSQTITLQDKLISGTNIKTINGESILGSGNITISGGSGSGSESRQPLYSHTITLKSNSAYFTFTIYVRADEKITKDNLFDYLDLAVCSGIGVVSNALIDKITFSTRADNTWVHKFLELSGQRIDEEPTFDSVFGTDFTVEDVVRGPDWIPPR